MKLINSASAAATMQLSNHGDEISVSSSDGDGNDEALFGDSFVRDDTDSISVSSTAASERLKNAAEGTKRDNESNLAREETKTIKRLKVILILFLLLIAALIATFVYKYTSQVQQEEFEAEFLEQATKLVDGFKSDSYQKMQALESFSKSLTLRQENWPFVTIQDSYDMFQPFLSLANAASIKILPIVKPRQRIEWEEHTASNQHWIEEDLISQGSILTTEDEEEGPSVTSSSDTTVSSSLNRLRDYEAVDEDRVSPFIKTYAGVDTSPEIKLPNWQYAPVLKNRWFLNFNELSNVDFYNDFQVMQATKKAIIAKTESYQDDLDFQSTRDLHFLQELLKAGGYGQYEPGEPIGYIHYPVFRYPNKHHDEVHNVTTKDNDIVAVISATVYWKTYFQDILPESAKGVICVVENDLQTFTYRIDGSQAIFLGMDDLHDPIYDDYEIVARYKSFEETDFDHPDSKIETGSSRRYTGVPVDETRLAYRIRVYPSSEMEEPYKTNEPKSTAIIAASILLLAVLVFLLYDWYVERRQNKVNAFAKSANAIVSSLFPASVKDKLFRQGKDDEDKKKSKNNMKAFKAGNNPMSNVMTGLGYTDETSGADNRKRDYGRDQHGSGDESDPPIADFFPSATVLFMDIAGFTAWSSTREPSQVFILLETCYNAFDRIAKHRGIFKVETIGDCYLAVCGLPEPCANHAPKMATFARDCLRKMNQLVHKLEPRLGPDTGDLTVRVGIHSGPVTAGVLRGERARFQLFGDTVNTASRMESTGKPGMIQVSSESAELITAHGKGSWLHERTDPVEAKGKGKLTTHWLLPQGAKSMISVSTSGNSCESRTVQEEDPIKYMSTMTNVSTKEKVQRLVRFNYDLLMNILKDIVAKHEAQDKANGVAREKRLSGESVKKGCCLDEVVEIIEMPEFDQSVIRKKKEYVKISHKIKSQLRLYCESIAESYNDENPFHGYEHAVHVIQSCGKLLSRIVAVRELGNNPENDMEKAHDLTFGITSDPLTQFAVIFAAMIHDVDHRGVPNNILAKEQPDMAEKYEDHAIAEQNSLEIAWNLLMDDNFAALRGAIFNNEESELKRFRSLLVNCLMATDIFDKHLKAIREQRWHNAFYATSDSTEVDEKKDDYSEVCIEKENLTKSRKATIVIEHIIQASDVSHCMQHWHVYRKWNEKLFGEMYLAYKTGRSNQDPKKAWYKGELWFFDNYVIPLSKKLEQCGVFGVSSDEYRLYAETNREEWEKKGESLVQEYSDRLEAVMGSSSNIEQPLAALDNNKIENITTTKTQSNSDVDDEIEQPLAVTQSNYDDDDDEKSA